MRRQGWLARLRAVFVEQGYFSLKPLPKTRAEAELEAETAGRGSAPPGVRLGLDAPPHAPERPDSP